MAGVQCEQTATKTFRWKNLNVDGAGNVIKEIMPIIRCDNGGVVMHVKVFFKKDTLKYVG